MSTGQQVPPWLQEQLVKLQQTQQNMQAVQMQKNQLESEKIATTRALDELQKASEGETVYKQAGSILVRASRDDLTAELKERQELAEARSTVLEKQEGRLKQSLEEQEKKINSMVAGSQGQGAGV